MVETHLAQKAFGVTLLISLVPNLLLYALPSTLLTRKSRKGELVISSLFLCFACGGLLGDVFIHILPHLLSEHDKEEAPSDGIQSDHHHDHDHEGEHGDHNHRDFISIGVALLFGFLFFFVFERVINSGLIRHDHSHGHGDDADSKRSKKDKDSTSLLSTTGWLNIAADCMHNFTDGVAIGATFASGGSIALATSISVFFHEIPHEIGDLSILIKSGMSKSEAIRTQFITAGTALIGTAVGLFAQRNEAIERHILAATAGGFVYISTVSILPSIAAAHSDFRQVVLEAACFLLGVSFMVAVAYLE
jgi:zinc transporter 7